MSAETPVEPPRASAPSWLVTTLGLVVVAVWVGLVFAPVHGFGLLDYGDKWLLGAHDRWRGFGDGRLAWMLEASRGGAWRPVLWASFGIDHLLGGTPEVLHRTSWALHVAAAAAFCACANAMLRVARPAWVQPRHVIVAAVCAALLWALHPLRAESVAWVSARGDVLAALFVCLAGWAWTSAIAGSRLRRGPAAAAAILGALAAASEPAACGTPLALLALTLWIARAAPDSAASRGLSRPLLLVSLPALAILVANLARRPDGPDFAALPAVLAASHRLVAPLRSTIFPAGLHAAHGAPDGFPDTIPPELWIDAATVAVLAVWAAVSLARGRGFGLAALAYAGFVAARMLVVQEPFGSDRDAHLATLAVLVALVVLVHRLARWIGTLGVGLLLVAPLVRASLPGALERWRDTRALWTHTLDVDPANDAASTGMGEAALGDAAGPRRPEAEAWFRRSLDRHGWRPHAHGAFGALQSDGGDRRVALEHLRASMSQAPWLPEPPYHLGVLLRELGEPADAGSALVVATRLDPESAPAWFQLGLARRSAGDREGAADALRRAAALAPEETRYADELKTVEGPAPR